MAPDAALLSFMKWAGAGFLLTLILLIWGGGKAYGALIAEFRAAKQASDEHWRTVQAFFQKFDEFKGEARREMTALKLTDREQETRIQFLERQAGLPPPWKRTQPVRPQTEGDGENE